MQQSGEVRRGSGGNIGVEVESFVGGWQGDAPVVDVAMLNGDDLPDLAAISEGNNIYYTVVHGDVDVVTANPAAGNVTLLLNDGGGKLSLAPGFPRTVAAESTRVKLGDLDGDGALEIAPRGARTSWPCLAKSIGSGACRKHHALRHASC